MFYTFGGQKVDLKQVQKVKIEYKNKWLVLVDGVAEEFDDMNEAKERFNFMVNLIWGVRNEKK